MQQCCFSIRRMQLNDTTDSTTLSYWLNWRVLLCVVSVLLSMVLACLTIWKRESSRNLTFDNGENQSTLCGDEAWKPCLKDIHPVCLLAFRVISFSSLLASLIAKIHVSHGTTFYYYTQWVFLFCYQSIFMHLIYLWVLSCLLWCHRFGELVVIFLSWWFKDVLVSQHYVGQSGTKLGSLNQSLGFNPCRWKIHGWQGRPH